jgi:hypothetical protein
VGRGYRAPRPTRPDAPRRRQRSRCCRRRDGVAERAGRTSWRHRPPCRCTGTRRARHLRPCPS